MYGHGPTTRKQDDTGQSNLRRISGAQPGVLDSTQLSRLLRVPGAKLSFAAFDPLTAYAQSVPDISKLNITTELYRPKRVVIEKAPTGECTWRFVPSAKREEGVADEGTWPRVVELCGEPVELSQDQWDIYKLDPAYECLVRAPPHLTVVQNITHYRPPSPMLSGKRQLESRSPSPSRTMPPPRATHNKNAFIDSEGEDEEEVESMITGDEQLRHKFTTKPFKKWKDEERQKRREKLHRKMERFFQNDKNHYDHHPNGYTFFQPPQTSGRESVTPEPGKRKATSALDTSWSPDAGELEENRLRDTNRTYATTSHRKRTRLVSPTTRQLERKRLERSKLKQQRRANELEARRWEREKRMINEIMEEVPLPRPGDIPCDDACQDVPRTSGDPSSNSSTSQTPSEEMFDEEAIRNAAIEESRRKLAELERDRPLWEQEARKRRLREEAEEQALRAKAEERRRKEVQEEAEARAKAQEERERKEMRKQEQEKKREQEKNVQRERELREQERRQRHQRWSFGAWTMQRALERYRVLSEAFDSTKFTNELPLSVDDVPWPVLESPVQFSVEDVSWDKVERFFETIRPHMRFQDYKALVEKSHRRFHPDRWRSRNLLKTVQDEAVRGCMEVAANTVAQALTPLWRSLTGR